MKKRLAIAAAALFLLAILSMALLRSSDREPRFEGRPLSAWVEDLRQGNGEAQGKAVRALEAMGAEAAPYLADRIAPPRGWAHRFKARVGPHIPERIKRPLRRVFDPSKQMIDQHTAAQALALIGTNGRTAVPKLTEMLQSGNVLLTVSASRALAKIGPDALEPLTAALDSGDFTIRAAACDALGELGTNAAPAAPRLARIIQSESGPIVSSAVYALSRIGEPSIPVLLPLLKSTNWNDRLQAANALGFAGVAAKPAEPALVELARDEHPRVRAAAIEALGRIDPFSRTSERAALAALNDPFPEMRKAALQNLRFRPRAVRENASALIAALEDPAPAVQGAAALALTAAPAEAAPALPRLEQLALQETNVILQNTALEALKILRSTTGH